MLRRIPFKCVSKSIQSRSVTYGKTHVGVLLVLPLKTVGRTWGEEAKGQILLDDTALEGSHPSTNTFLPEESYTFESMYEAMGQNDISLSRRTTCVRKLVGTNIWFRGGREHSQVSIWKFKEIAVEVTETTRESNRVSGDIVSPEG